MNKTVFSTIKAKIGLKAECILDTDEERQLVWDVLEKADRYRWHDLREDPADFPSKAGMYFVAYTWKKSRIINYRLESFNGICFFEPVEMTLLAWKELEPLDEVTDD